jgi:hypothetical protein
MQEGFTELSLTQENVESHRLAEGEGGLKAEKKAMQRKEQ